LSTVSEPVMASVLVVVVPWTLCNRLVAGGVVEGVEEGVVAAVGGAVVGEEVVMVPAAAGGVDELPSGTVVDGVGAVVVATGTTEVVGSATVVVTIEMISNVAPCTVPLLQAIWVW
jgi:hypothetical protein